MTNTGILAENIRNYLESGRVRNKMPKLCKDCEYFKIISEPFGYEWGQAVCKKYDLTIDFRNHGKFDTLECVEKEEDISQLIKPCPFCGGEAEIKERHRNGVANRKMYWIECKTCGISQCHHDLAGYKTKSNAITAWNKRKEG